MTSKKLKSKPVTVARSSPRKPSLLFTKAGRKKLAEHAARLREIGGHYSDMPWCEHCQAYHMPTAPHILYGDVEPKPAPRVPDLHVILIGDIVSGFDVYGPFQSGHDAVTWKQQTGNRERTQGQWFLMPLRTP